MQLCRKSQARVAISLQQTESNRKLTTEIDNGATFYKETLEGKRQV